MEFDIRDKILYGCDAYSKKVSILVIPEGVEEIAFDASKELPQLEEVIMPNSVKVIRKLAFSDCRMLKKVTMSENLIKIGEGAFTKCPHLKEIFLKNVKIIDDWAFGYCSNLTNVTILNGLEKIGKMAFYGCMRLISINIPSSVYKIGKRAFMLCKNLKSISLSRNLKEIGNSAFSKCYELESILLPMSLEKIGSDLLADEYTVLLNDCYYILKNLKEITVEKGVFEKLDYISKYLSLPSCIRNYYTGKIHYSEEDINAFKAFLEKSKIKYLKLFLKKEKITYSKELFPFKELFKFALDMNIIPYEFACYLVDIIDDIEIRFMLLEYINKKFGFKSELDKLDIGEIGDEDSKKHK